MKACAKEGVRARLGGMVDVVGKDVYQQSCVCSTSPISPPQSPIPLTVAIANVAPLPLRPLRARLCPLSPLLGQRIDVQMVQPHLVKHGEAQVGHWGGLGGEGSEWRRYTSASMLATTHAPQVTCESLHMI